MTTRIHLTPDDLVRVRLIPAPAPLVEVVVGVAELRRDGWNPYRNWWQRQARRSFPATSRILLDLIPASGSSPDFLLPPVQDLDQALDTVCATPTHTLRAQLAKVVRPGQTTPSWFGSFAEGDRELMSLVRQGLLDFYRYCVEPYWPRIVAAFQVDQAERTRVLAASGVRQLLSSLHRDLSLHGALLERAWGDGECRCLDGSGLQLVPSALWTGPPLYSPHPPDGASAALIYPAWPGHPESLANGSANLATLFGRTRAEVLKGLRGAPCGTAELATRLGISASSASEHTTVLRNAGLIRTVRSGRGVRHSLTALGRDLMNGH